MAAETIDALLIEIGFDTSKLTQEERKALDSFKRVDEGAHRMGVNVERSTKSIDSGFSLLRTGALGLAGAFAAIAAKDMVDFIAKTVSADAAVGRLSRNIGVSTVEISRWANASKIYGGTPEQMATTYKNLSDQVRGWKSGLITPLAAELRNLYSAALSIDPSKAQIPDLKDDVNTVLMKEARNLGIVHGQDPALAGLFQSRMGLDPAMFDMMIREGDHLAETLQKVGEVTDQAAEAASRLELAWRRFQNAKDNAEKNLSRTTTDIAGPTVEAALNWSSTFLTDPSKAGSDLAGWATDKNFWSGATDGSFFSWITKKSTWWSPTPSPAPSSPAPGISNKPFGSVAEKEAFIRAEAVRQGQNPDVWAALARSEGLTSFYGDRDATGTPTSFGALQLHYPGVGRNTADGLGTLFTKETGLDARSPDNEAAAIRWAMRYAATHGLRDWHGWRGPAFANLEGGGARGSSTTDIAINGPINIYAGQNADGEEIASKFRKAILARQSAAAQANGGQQ